MAPFLYVINNPIIYNFFKGFTKRKRKERKKTNRAVVFGCRPFPNILKYKENKSGKQDSLRQLLMSSANM